MISSNQLLLTEFIVLLNKNAIVPDADNSIKKNSMHVMSITAQYLLINTSAYTSSFNAIDVYQLAVVETSSITMPLSN